MFIAEKDFIKTVNNDEVIIFVHNVTIKGISSINGHILDIETRQEIKRFSIGYNVVKGCMVDKLGNLTESEYDVILSIFANEYNYD